MLTFSNLTLGYHRHPAVHHLNTTIEKGDFLALVGPNGAGKSTLMKAILGHIQPMEGSVHYTGITKKDISYLPQSSSVDRTFPLIVEQFVATGLWHQKGLFGRISKQDRHNIEHSLEQVGLQGLGRRPIEALSGGQFQRLLFARKLMQKSKLLLLDEPFTGVDEKTVQDLMNILHNLHSQGATIVAVIHNTNLVKAHFPSALLLSRELIAHGPTEQVLTEPLLAAASSRAFSTPSHEVCEVTPHEHA